MHAHKTHNSFSTAQDLTPTARSLLAAVQKNDFFLCSCLNSKVIPSTSAIIIWLVYRGRAHGRRHGWTVRTHKHPRMDAHGRPRMPTGVR